MVKASGNLLMYLKTSKCDAATNFAKALTNAGRLIRSRKDSSGRGFHPVIEVHPERFRPLADSLWLTLCNSSRIGRQVGTKGVVSYDALLKKAAGEGNDIIIWFLRIVSVAALVTVPFGAIWWLVAMLL